MTGLETAAFALGAAVVKNVCGIWLGEAKLLDGLAGEVVDLAVGRLRTAREKRQFFRVREQLAELVADRLEPVLRREFAARPDELDAVVAAVTETLDTARLTDADLFQQDLDAGYLYRFLLPRTEPARWGLSAGGSALYRRLLSECCAYLIETVRNLPSAGMSALTELLRRDTQILAEIRAVLERLPVRRGTRDFEADYRQLVANRLDRIEFFGATLSEASRRYPLSVAYLSLSVSGELLSRPRRRRPYPPGYRPPTGSPTARVTDALAASRRLFVRGQAGIGKTTLLQWIAVRCAQRSLPEFGDSVPFLLPLRRYAATALPAPERFLSETGRHISDEMPPGWVQEQLRSGRAVVLVDGVDELAEDRRDEARAWLSELVETFPRARYVVTSRPSAVPENWLGRDDFDVAELEPMTPADVAVFVHRWHEAMRSAATEDAERAELTAYEEGFLAALSTRSHLRRLSGYPLLCALLCALHRDRRAQLPENRMELYEVALQMLLERRDRERQIAADLALSRTEKTLLLQELAYWLIRNGWSDAPTDQAALRVTARLAGMNRPGVTGDAALRHLLERCGLLREPVEGRIDFVHRTFQEYLAAKAAIDAADLGVLLEHSHLDQWREVIVLAAGQAPAAKRAELLTGLLDRARTLRGRRRARDGMLAAAVASLETSPELSPDLRADIETEAARLLPPRNLTAARALASLGSTALDLLANVDPTTPQEVAATIRAAAESGDPAGLRLIARFRDRPQRTVVAELLRAWDRFDPQEYAREVLRDCRLEKWGPEDGFLAVAAPERIPALRHLTHLRTLRCWLDLGGDLSYVRGLPQLSTLLTGDLKLRQLDDLADTQLTEVYVEHDNGFDLPPLDLSPLARIASLTSVSVLTRRVVGLAGLARHPRLRSLWAHGLALAEVEALRPLAALEHLAVGHVDGLRDLDPLGFLTKPNVIGIYKCPDLRDLGGLRRWADSLTGLNLELTAPVALGVLAALPGATFLVLSNTAAYDLDAVARMPGLTHLTLRGRLPDLAPLRDAPVLNRLVLGYDVSEVDLTALTGRRNLTVDVDRTTVVHGADALGEGSRVRRV